MSASSLIPGATRIALLEFYVLESETLVFVVTPDTQEPILERAPIGAKPLRAAANRLMLEFSPSQINPAHPEWTTDLAHLEPIAEALFATTLVHCSSVDLVYVVPHGALFYLPFHALRTASGSYLIEEKPVAYAPSATLLASARLRRRHARTDALLTAGVGAQGDPEPRRQDFEDEATALAAADHWSSSAALVGPEASKRELMARSADADVIHIACHGLFNEHDPLASGLLLADGVLSAREIAECTLDATLVYLSACVSGRHDVAPGDEILGLARGLIRAGVASSVLSLWPVAASAPTRRIMERFYAHWLGDGLSKAQALQAAQVETLAEHGHPYHWAPFVLIGDWA